MLSPCDAPDIAVVLPLYRHSVLVADALASVFTQQTHYSLVVIVVNDGCPFPESDLQIRCILSVYPGVVRYVLQNNSGLSAARNTGIDYALTHFPSLKAIYFLDADNFILPGALQSAFSKLMAEPETSWVYPNIDMFGIKRNFDYSGPYSVLRHTQHNICEAGSLVHRRVFDAGIRFDERMKSGFEDWDFWLTAAAAGFRGAPDPHFGFRYRNRGESMLSESERVGDEIRAYMLRKHAPLVGGRSLLRLESAEAPRYAIIFSDSDKVLITSAGDGTGDVFSHAEFEEMLWRNITVPGWQYIPPFFVLMTRVLFEELSRLGLILWVLHDSECVLKTMNIACLRVDRSPGRAFEVKDGGKVGASHILAISRDLVSAIICDGDTSWIEQIVSPEAHMKVSIRTLTVPLTSDRAPDSDRSVIAALLTSIYAWRSSPLRPVADRSWIWRELSIPPPHSLYFDLRAAFGGEVVYPGAPVPRNIAFVLPIASFGGAERVAYNLAHEFTRSGWRAHLFVIGTNRIEIPHEFAGSFASINFLDDPVLAGWDENSVYQGTSLPAGRNHPGAAQRVAAALAWVDVVVNCHSGGFHLAAADLRRMGVKTVAHVHLLEQTPFGRSLGHPMIALSYEHVYDLILTASSQLASWFHGAGIPSQKLLHVRNAPGYPLETAAREGILARRTSSSKHRLNVLYIGRLDRQKGIDRLAEVVKRTLSMGLPIEWRIVGSPVSGDTAPIPPVLLELIEPPAIEGEALTNLYAWADVMVLLSDYEGVPLSILEAQRLGVVVIATDAGAVSEVISSGKTGFLISRQTAVEEAVGLLSLFSQAPGFLARTIEAAPQIPEWPETAKEFIDRVTELVDEPKYGRSFETSNAN